MAQLEEKQKYLRENILQKQYDAQQFMDFCQAEEGSVDIGAWSLSQLKKIVKKFIQQQQRKRKSEQIELYNYESPRKQEKNSDNAFNNWSDFIETVPKKEQPKSFELNLADLNFLQSFGMGNSNQPIQKPSQGIVSNSKPSIIPIHKQVQQKPSSTFNLNNKPKNPNDILIKNLQSNEGFISVLNNPNTNNKNPFEELQKQQNPTFNNKISTDQSKNASISSNQNVKSNPQFVRPQRDISSPSQIFTLDLKCKQIAINKIPENLICTITNHEIINPNVFIPKFVQYSVTSSPLNITVKRRMKDFDQLRILLKKMFPTTQIPHLQRYFRLSQTQPHVIAKQKLYLESYLSSLLMNPLLRCKILEDFLFCTDQALFKKIFREYEKMEKPKAIEDLWTITGKIKLDTTTASRKYMNQQQLYIDYISNSFGKIKTLYDQLILYYQNTSKIVSEIAQVYEQIRQTTQSVNQAFNQNSRFESFLSMVEEVSHIHKQMSQSLQRKSKIIQSQLKHMFKYEQENFVSMRQTMKILTTIYQAYEKRNDKDAANKDNYQNKKLAEYKSAAEIPSKHITVLKYQSAYAQNQYKQQICRYMDQLTRKIGGKFQIFTTLEISIAADMDLVWRAFQQFVQKGMSNGIGQRRR